MCAGLAALVGPPSLAGVCYGTWWSGRTTTAKSLHITPPAWWNPLSAGAGAGALVGSYKIQNWLVIRHFDQGGRLSLNFEKGFCLNVSGTAIQLFSC